MSTVKAARHHIGISATPTQNFTLTAEALDGSMKLARGNPGATTQDILTVDNAGYLYANVVPPQFDNTGKLATTSFVRQAAGNYSTYALFNNTATLTAAHAGSIIELYGGSTFTVTLPTLAAVGSYSRIKFINLGTVNISIAPQGADAFLNNPANSTTPISLQPGDTLELCSFNAWVLTGGSYQLRNASTFGSVKATNGYQKLPSGLILQWGFVTATVSGVVATFPIQFPSNAAAIYTTPGQGTQTTVYTSAGAATASNVTIYANTGPIGVYWMAIGF